jgi:hypothetical protein
MSKKLPSNAWKPGESGNPGGRPKFQGTTEEARKAIKEGALHIVAALFRQALAGDTVAAKVLLERAIAPLRPVAAPVEIDIAGETLTERAGKVMDAVGRGEVSVPDAKTLLDSLLQLARIEAMGTGGNLTDDLFKGLDDLPDPDAVPSMTLADPEFDPFPGLDEPPDD